MSFKKSSKVFTLGSVDVVLLVIAST